MTACEAMTVAAAARTTIGSRAHSGTSRKNGLRMLPGSPQDQCALSQVTEDAGGEDQDQPDAGNRGPAEVPHVRVQRFGPGDGENDSGQREERDPEMADQEAQGVGGRQRFEDLGMGGDTAHADQRRSRRTRCP